MAQVQAKMSSFSTHNSNKRWKRRDDTITKLRLDICRLNSELEGLKAGAFELKKEKIALQKKYTSNKLQATASVLSNKTDDYTMELEK